MTRPFEFDPAKSQANLAKHGIDFRTAQELWGDPRLVTLDSPTVSETRFLCVGAIRGTVWTAIFTIREDRIRIIIVRRARLQEARLYEGQ